jgi:hypothetical protein
VDEIMQLKSIWFDIEMQTRTLEQQRQQVEKRLRELLQEKQEAQNVVPTVPAAEPSV